MGEYAEMMLDGTCCVMCGEYLFGGRDGFAVTCPSCSIDTATSRPPKRKMGKATQRFLLRAFADGKTFKYEMNAQAHSLLDRGYAERCRRYGYAKLTKDGVAKAKEIRSTLKRARGEA